MGVANGTHVHAQQLQFGAHVGTCEGRLAITVQRSGQGAGHGIARGHQAENLLFPERALPNGVHMGIGSGAVIVDHDAAAFADLQATGPGQGILGTNAGREHDKVCFQEGLVAEVHAKASVLALDNGSGCLLCVHLNAEFLDFVTQQGAAVGIKLNRHQPGGKLHHVGCQSQALERIGCFKAQQATADDHTGTGTFGAGANGIQVIKGAVHQAVGPVIALNRRHERIRAGGQHQFVVPVAAPGRFKCAIFPVNAGHLLVQVQLNALLGVPLQCAHREIGVGGTTEILRQMNSVIGQLFLLAKHDDFVVVGRRTGAELLQKVMADHTIADDDQGFLAHGSVLFRGSWLKAHAAASQ